MSRSSGPALILMAGEMFDLAFQVGDAIVDAASIRFQFGFARSSGPDAATQARKLSAATGESWKQVTQLG